MEHNGKKVRSGPKVIKNLMNLRDELAQWKQDYVCMVIVERIDRCLTDDFDPVKSPETDIYDAEKLKELSRKMK